MQSLNGVPPVTSIDQIVPIRDEVAQGAAVIAERDATVHTPAGLRSEAVLAERLVDLLPVPEPDRYRSTVRELPVVFEEASGVAHDRS